MIGVSLFTALCGGVTRVLQLWGSGPVRSDSQGGAAPRLALLLAFAAVAIVNPMRRR